MAVFVRSALAIRPSTRTAINNFATDEWVVLCKAAGTDTDCRALDLLPAMSTFDAIAQIRREALTQAQALRFLIEHFGFSVLYAREIIAAAFGDEDRWGRVPVTSSDPVR